MELTWYGRTCIRLRGRDATVVSDAYQAVVGPTGRGITADIVTYSQTQDRWFENEGGFTFLPRPDSLNCLGPQPRTYDFDGDGFLHISGRKKNVIISRSGKNVFPEEIEDLINRSPFVLESLVYGEKDPKEDEVIAAEIVVDAEAFIELSELKGIKITDELLRKVIAEEIQKVNKQLAGYKQIKRFHIRDQEFEKTTAQKIKRYLVAHA